MPRGLIATAPRTPELREYDDAPLQPTQIRIKTELASPKHGTELVGYRNDPVASKPYDFALGATMQFSSCSLTYFCAARTKEFETQDGLHLFGGLKGQFLF